MTRLEYAIQIEAKLCAMKCLERMLGRMANSLGMRVVRDRYALTRRSEMQLEHEWLVRGMSKRERAHLKAASSRA